jgi:hypothetical protein
MCQSKEHYNKNEYLREWRRLNADKKKEQNRRYREKHKLDIQIESADVDNCVTLCKVCHKDAHNIKGCKYSDLSKYKKC